MTTETDNLTEIQVQDLRKGDVLVFDGGARHTVDYSEPSSIDPVHLIGFDDDTTQIAKDSDDFILIDEGAAA